MSEEYKLTIVPFNDTLNGLEYRYTLHKDGWLWGHFKTKELAEQHGKLHLERAIIFGNDWGIPKEELGNHTLSSLAKEENYL